MAALTQQQIQAKHHPLDFTYRDYLKLQKNLENVKIKQYCFLQQIGEGAFAQVYKAINEQTNKLVAIKIINLRNIESEQSPRVKAIRKRLAKEESKIMMKFNSPNLLKCYECFENRDLKFMVIEFCAEGSLQDKIETMKKIPQFQAVSILKQIINGVAECHTQKIIHRDLKADNILCNNGEYKIADFGFSKQLRIETEEELSRNTCLGTMTTMAPEVLKRENYGLKADIWSVGVIFFQMLFGECPFKSNTSAEMITEIMSSKLMNNEVYKGVQLSPEASKFIREVLVVDINKRLGWRQLLEHELFKVKVESLPATFNRRVQIRRHQQLEDIEREFLQTPNQNLSNLTHHENSFHFNSNKNESPNKQAQKFNKKQRSEDKPLYTIQSLSQNEKSQQENQTNNQKKESSEKQKTYQKDIHQSLEEYTHPTKNLKVQEPKTTFTKLKPEEMNQIKQSINKEDAQIYKWAHKIHIQCLKTQCIYNSIIKPIQKHSLLDMSHRKNIELMYLIATRCRNNISPIKFEYEKRKTNSIIQDIHYEVQQLYNDVVGTWQSYCSLLTSKENQKIVILKDWFSKKFTKQEMKMKDKYLTGVENMTKFRPEGSELKKIKQSKLREEDLKDYEKEEQIEYTNEYILEVVKELKPKNYVKDVRNYLIHYKDICRIEAEDLKNREFRDYLGLVLL